MFESNVPTTMNKFIIDAKMPRWEGSTNSLNNIGIVVIIIEDAVPANARTNIKYTQWISNIYKPFIKNDTTDAYINVRRRFNFYISGAQINDPNIDPANKHAESREIINFVGSKLVNTEYMRINSVDKFITIQPRFNPPNK